MHFFFLGADVFLLHSAQSSPSTISHPSDRLVPAIAGIMSASKRFLVSSLNELLHVFIEHPDCPRAFVATCQACSTAHGAAAQGDREKHSGQLSYSLIPLSRTPSSCHLDPHSHRHRLALALRLVSLATSVDKNKQQPFLAPA